MKKPPSLAWYIVAGGTLMVGMALAGIGYSQQASTVEEMQRIAMPGAADVILPPGQTTLYVEGPSWRDANVVCTLDGKVVGYAASQDTYDSGGYTGQSVFETQLPSGGTFHLACTGNQSFQVAVGRGAGAARALIFAAILPIVAALAIFAVVALRRRGAAT